MKLNLIVIDKYKILMFKKYSLFDDKPVAYIAMSLYKNYSTTK